MLIKFVRTLAYVENVSHTLEARSEHVDIRCGTFSYARPYKHTLRIRYTYATSTLRDRCTRHAYVHIRWKQFRNFNNVCITCCVRRLILTYYRLQSVTSRRPHAVGVKKIPAQIISRSLFVSHALEKHWKNKFKNYDDFFIRWFVS